MKTDSAGRGLESLPLVPLRDMVVFPHMMQPFVVGRESSIRALEAALTTPVKRLFLAAQRDPQLDEPDARGHLRRRRHRHRRPVPEASQRPHQGDGRGRAAGPDHGLRAPGRRTSPSPSRSSRCKPADAESLKDYMGKVLALFEQYAKLSHHLAFEGLAASLKIDDPERFADTLSAHLAVATAEKQALLEAESPYERLQKLQDLLEVEIDKVNIDRRINNKVKKQMEKAQKEYYLNEKIKAIHQELGRKDDRTDEVEDLKKKIETSGMPKEVREKAETGAAPAGGDAPGLGRGDGLAQLHRVARGRALEEGVPRVQGPDARREDPERRPLRPREGQGADPRVPGGPPARSEDEGLDHLLRRAPGRRQDLARQVDRPLAEPAVRAALARRRAGRGRDPRPPADLHRRLPGPDHPDDEEGGHRQPGLPARRGRQDVLGLPGRPGVGAARGPGPGAEPLLRRPLPGRRVRPLEGHVHRHGQHRGPDPAGPQGPDGADPPLGLHAQREGRDRAPSSWCPSSARPTASRPTRSSSRTTTILAHHRELHAGGRRAEPRAGDRRRLPQGRPQDRPEEGRDAGAASRPRTSRTSSASPASATAARARCRRSGSRRAWPGPRRAARS